MKTKKILAFTFFCIMISFFAFSETNEKLLQKEAEFSTDQAVYYELAAMYSQQGNLEQSKKEMNKALYYGLYDMITLSKEKGLENFRTTDMWKKIEGSEQKVFDLLYELKTQDIDGEGYTIAYLESLESALHNYFNKDDAPFALIASSKAYVYYKDEQYDLVAKEYLSVLEIEKKIFGEENPAVAASMVAIGVQYYNISKFEEALDWFLKGFSILQKLPGKEYDLAQICENISDTYESIGDNEKRIAYKIKSADSYMAAALEQSDLDLAKKWYTNANTYYDEAVLEKSVAVDEKMRIRQRQEEICKIVYGENSKEISEIYNYLGVLYFNNGDKNNSLIYFQKALAAAEQNNGDNRMTVLKNISIVYDNLNFFDEEIKHVPSDENKKAIAASQNSYFRKAIKIENEGLKLAESGKYDDALVKIFDSLGIVYYLYGEENFETAKVFNNIATVYLSSGQYQKALAYFLRSLIGAEKCCEQNKDDSTDANYFLATVYDNMCGLYYRMSEWNLALPYGEKALSIRLQNNDKSSLCNSYNNIGLCFFGKGEYDKALDSYVKAIEIQKKVHQKQDRVTATIYENISSTYSEKNDYVDALKYEQKSYELRKELLGSEHPDVAASCNNFAMIYLWLGDYDKALDFCKQGIAIREQCFGKDNLYTAESYNSLSLIYESKGNFKQALEYDNMMLDIYKAVLGDMNPQTALGYNNCGCAYQKAGQVSEAQTFFEKALAIQTRIYNGCHHDIAITYNNMAINCMEQDKYDDALNYLGTALSVEEKALGCMTSFTAVIYTNMAKIFCKQSNYEKGLSYYQKALALQIQILGKEHPDVVTTYESIAGIQTGCGNFQQAEEIYNKALAIQLKQLGEVHPGTANTYRVIGTFYNTRSDYVTAMKYLEKALEIQQKVYPANHPEIIATLDAIGTTYANQGKYDEAILNENKAVAMSVLFYGENSSKTAVLYKNLGTMYRETGDVDSALDRYEKALTINQRVFGEQSVDAALAENQIGLLLLMKGDYNHALVYFKDAVVIYEKTSLGVQINLAASYSNIGLSYSNKNEYDLAMEYQEKALAIYEKVLGKQSDGTALCYNNMGSICQNRKEYQQALSWYTKALAIFKDLGEQNPENTAITYLNMGNTYFKIGDYDNAYNYFIKATNSYELLFGENSSQAADGYNGIGLSYYGKKENQKAIEYFNKALNAWSKSYSYSSILFHTWDYLRNIKDGDYDFYARAISVGINAAERARLDVSSAKQEYMVKALPLFYTGIFLESSAGNDDKAFEYSEAMRSRGFLDQLGTEAALRLDGVTDDERTKIHALNEEITLSRFELDRQNNMPVDKRDDQAELLAGNNLTQAEQKLAQIDDAIAKRIPKYGYLRNPKPVSATEAKKWCGKNRAVLEYVLWDKSIDPQQDSPAALYSYCIVVTADKIVSVPIDETYEYSKAVKELRNNISNCRPEKKYEDTRNDLYKKLIEPVIDKIPADITSIVIVPDGSLAFLPFDILRKNSGSDDFGERYAISFSPSVSVSILSDVSDLKSAQPKALAFGGAWYNSQLTEDEHRTAFVSSEENQRGASKRGAGISTHKGTEAEPFNDVNREYIIEKAQKEGAGIYFADQSFEWNDLPGTLSEIKVLQKEVFTEKKMTLYSGESVAEETIKKLSEQKKLQTYSIVHLACHGYFDNTVSDMSSVVFSEVSGLLKDKSSDDGYLTVSETALLDFNADMVCLSACETGLGEIKRGDGMVGLSRAFMVAGAHHVGVSLWSVDDEATASFMCKMYMLVQEQGMTYRDAYQKVKEEFRKDEKWSNPFYWAAFTLYE